MKILVPFSKKYIDFYIQNDIDGLILGIDNFSMNFNSYVKIEEIDKIIKTYNKEVYVCFNKLYYENELNDLKNTLIEISKLNITGVFFSDVCVYNIVKENNLNINLILDLSHLITSFNVVNFWNKRNVKEAFVSTEITVDEIIEIKNNTSSKIGVKLYGYLNMATSSRELLSNYFEFKKQKKDKNKYLMNEKEDDYPIVEENGITNIFSSKVLNGLEYLPKLIENKIDYIILDNYLLDEKNFTNIIDAYASIKNNYKDKEFVLKQNKVVIDNTNNNVFDGFLNKKTIYKVKNNE